MISLASFAEIGLYGKETVGKIGRVVFYSLKSRIYVGSYFVSLKKYGNGFLHFYCLSHTLVYLLEINTSYCKRK